MPDVRTFQICVTQRDDAGRAHGRTDLVSEESVYGDMGAIGSSARLGAHKA